MITKIAIENFKGIKDRVEIDLKPITLLFGPNSSGKSTIVQALHYAREIFCRRNFDPGSTEIGGSTVDLGGFTNFVHRHDTSQSIKIRIDIDLEKQDLPEYVDWVEKEMLYEGIDELMEAVYSKGEKAWVEVEIKWLIEINKPDVVEYKTGINDDFIAIISLDKMDFDGKGKYKISKFNFKHPLLKKFNLGFQVEDYSIPEIFILLLNLSEDLRGNLNELNLFLPDNCAIPIWGSQLDIPDLRLREESGDNNFELIKEFLSRVLVGPGEIISRELEGFRYIGPLRQVPSRNYQPERFPKENRWSNGLAAWDILYNASDNLLNDVNNWLLNKLDSQHEIYIKEYRELEEKSDLMVSILRDDYLDDPKDLKKKIIKIESKKRLYLSNDLGVEVMPSDIGVGVSQLLPVVVGTLIKKESILAIEQPELHLHPAIQVNLADLFISQIKSKNNICKYIIETHSEHFMLRFLRRIRETGKNIKTDYPLDPKDLNVVIVEEIEYKDEKERPLIRMVSHSIPVDEKGHFEMNWPDGFFEERYEEYFS